MAALAESFLAPLAAAERAGADAEALEALLAEHLRQARQAWPRIDVAGEIFSRWLGDRVVEHTAPLAETLARLHGVDLYLAAGCATGTPATAAIAIAALRERYFPDLDAVLRHMGATTTLVDDVKQRMLETLFVAVGDELPKIANYSGRGDLRSWLRSVAVRTALKLMARDRRSPGTDSDLDALADAGDDPEIAHLKRRYAAEFKEALEEALAGLTQRQRTLLRLHHLDGLNIDELGRLFRVHRATAARWVAAAREALFEDTRLRLSRKIGIEATDFASIVRLVQSQLDVSMGRLLGD